MPINWSHGELFCVQRSNEEHERCLQHDAFCYMLANYTIGQRERTRVRVAMSETELLGADFFISFLFRRVLKAS